MTLYSRVGGFSTFSQIWHARSFTRLTKLYLIVCLIIYKIFIILDKTARSNVFSRNKWQVYKTVQIDSSMSPDALTQIGLTIKFLLTFRMYICKKSFQKSKSKKKIWVKKTKISPIPSEVYSRDFQVSFFQLIPSGQLKNILKYFPQCRSLSGVKMCKLRYWTFM